MHDACQGVYNGAPSFELPAAHAILNACMPLDIESIHIEPVSDRDLIMSAMSHPRVWPHISDDSAPTPDSIKDKPFDGMMFLGAFSGADFLGVFMIHALNGCMVEIHTALLPNAWGATSTACALGVLDWVFENTPYLRVVTNVPDGNDHAFALAKKVGMSEFGYNPCSILRGGELRGQRMLGINKGQTCQSQQ